MTLDCPATTVPAGSPAADITAARPPADQAVAWTVAVRELCEFAAKSGDLDLRFTPSPTAQQGIAGHQLVAARRGDGQLHEVPLVGRHGPLQVRGRADGVDLRARRVEEVKTHRGPLARQPDNHRALHWAQARVYGWLLCQQHGWDEATVALVYFDIASQQETTLAERCSAAQLQAHFTQLCQRFLGCAQQQSRHRQARDAALAALPFVHGQWRDGQRQLAEQVFRAARRGRCLMAQAPTGIGKTLGTVYPMLKACAGTGLDKLFFLSVKGSGRQLAVQALATITRAAPGLPLRVLELQSRESACEHPDRSCHGQSCPLAQGFYDRLPAARAQAAGVAGAVSDDSAADPAAPPLLDTATLRDIARQHAVCPYYLAQEMVRWADVVVGDCHHAFDAHALLPALTAANGWRTALLLDEAHNLIERARAMYSVQLHPVLLQQARRQAPAALKRPLDRVHRAWRSWSSTLAQGGQGTSLQADATAPGQPEGITAADATATQPAYHAQDEVPAALARTLQDAAAAISDWLAGAEADGPSAHPPLPGALQDFHFAALQFGRLYESFGPHSVFESVATTHTGRGGRAAWRAWGIRNVLPAPFLAPRWAQAHAAVLFSATLAPQPFYAQLLGLPDDTAWLDVASPFQPQQLSVHIASQVSTRWRQRAQSLQPLAALMARQFQAQPGNYLAFFSSFDYLAQAHAELAGRHPHIPTWCQQRGMDDAQRQAFLARFDPAGQGIGFAVLGGVFAEGIDLPGARLIGAFIATLGLPQWNPVNEAMRRRLDAAGFDGQACTYLYPGLRKVVQAAGRVIRTTEDRGCVWLIDDRYRRPEVRALLPAWWALPQRGAAPA